MLSDLSKAISDLGIKEVRRILWIALALAAAALILLVTGLSMTLAHLSLAGIGWLDTLISWLGSFAVAFVAVLLFPATVNVITGIFLDRVAAIVEAKHYPDAARTATEVPVMTAVISGLRMVLISIALNLLLLPVYLFLPVINLAAFLLVNGYLIGREFLELIALRHLPPTDATAVRRKRRFAVILAGMAMAALSTIPIVNLVVPVLSAAFFTHRFQSLRSSGQIG